MRENVSKAPVKNYGVYSDSFEADNMRKWCEVNYDSMFEVKQFENSFYVVRA
jgi:hypothetical protein